MAEQGKPKGKFSYPFTTITLIVVGVFWLVSVPVSWYNASAREESQRPDLALNSFVRALRDYRERNQMWPERLEQLSKSKTWEVSDDAMFGDDGRNMELANYYYRYFILDKDVVSVWAIPVGNYAHLGSTHFVLLGRGRMRHWMGGPLRREDAKMVISYPTDEQFAMMMLKEIKAGSEQKGGGGGASSLLKWLTR